MKERLVSESELKQIVGKIKEKFPITKCREVLERKGRNYTEEEILMIRDFLMNISRAAYQTFQKQIQKELEFKSEKVADNIIPLNINESKITEIKNAA